MGDSSNDNTTTANSGNDGADRTTAGATTILPKMSVVTPQRKEELLLLARNERRQWIERVPLPYDAQQLHEGKKVKDDGSIDLWTLPLSSSAAASSNNNNSSLYRMKIKSSIVSQKIPSCLGAISELYGVPTTLSTTETSSATTNELSSSKQPLNIIQVAERIDSLVSSFTGVLDSFPYIFLLYLTKVLVVYLFVLFFFSFETFVCRYNHI